MIAQGTVSAVSGGIVSAQNENGINRPLLKIQKLHRRVTLPDYESENAAGMDLRAFLETDVTIPPLGRVKIPTGLRIELPEGFEGQVRPRSGLAIKTGLTVLNSPGTIDSDYRGDVEIILVNLGEKDVIIKDGERIAQLVVAPVCRAIIQEADTLAETKRGVGGFGSTGV
jgi:dUTP pyrophosphatase